MYYDNVISRKEVIDCLICHDAPCTAACGRLPCGELLRSLVMDNQVGAAQEIFDPLPCADCEGGCQAACVSPNPVPIRRLLLKLAESKKTMEPLEASNTLCLETDMCGLKLENPFLLSSSVVASSYDMCARAFDMGWAGAAFKTLSNFPIIEASPRFSATKEAGGAFIGFKNIEQLSENPLDVNLDIIRRLKASHPNKMFVASIMGRDEAEWTHMAKCVSQAGADVIECNFSCPHMSGEGLGSDVGQHPELVGLYTKAVRKGSDKPILAKMTPNLGSMLPAAIAAASNGANGIAAINTVKSVCNVNLDTYATSPSVRGRSSVGGYSGAAVKPIALRFIAELANSEALKGCHISGMGGVYTWRDALEMMLLGAGSIQITTAVMEYGYRIIDDLLSGLRCYMLEKGVSSLRDLIGAAAGDVVPTDALERGSIQFPSFELDKCLGCGRCYISCRDGGHSAIAFDPVTRRPKLDGGKCVGCQLCLLVCPAQAITPVRKRVKARTAH